MWRLSLRELLVLVAAVALAIVSLRYASDGWLAIVAAVAMMGFFVALIVAAVDRGPRQAFAIGFALTMAGYALIVMNGNAEVANVGTRNRELDPWEGRLPTTRLLRYVKISMDASKWVDTNSGAEVIDYDPSKGSPTTVNQAGFTVPAVTYVESPPREFFMPIGHCWWGLVLGYLGGLFAAFVYKRRVREQKPLATQPS